MDRWKNKVAVVTGASSGIGAAITVELVKQGMKVVGLARRLDRIEALKKTTKGSGELNAFKCDVAKEDDIKAAFKFVKAKFGALHVLINNAGVARPGKVSAQEPKYLREVLDVNVIGLSICTQQALKVMKETGIDDGHIIHINSVLGHQVAMVGGDQITSMYTPSKYAVTALTEVLRQELRLQKSMIKITSISPGYVKTEITQASMEAIGAPLDTEMFKGFADIPALEAQDIAEGVVYVLSTPPRVQVHELTIKPIGEEF